MSKLRRLGMHSFAAWFQLRRRFPKSLLDELTRTISEGEREHLGEVRFAIESRLPPAAVWAGLDARSRAVEVFARLGVWDTEYNVGVLIYVLLAEHRIDIVADRGIAKRVPQEAWDAICAHMREHYAQGRWREGSLQGVAEVHALLARHFPSDGRERPDELPDQPIIL